MWFISGVNSGINADIRYGSLLKADVADSPKKEYTPQIGIGHQNLQSKCSLRQTRSSAATSNRLFVLFFYKRGLDGVFFH